jgi:hypothetical protein
MQGVELIPLSTREQRAGRRRNRDRFAVHYVEMVMAKANAHDNREV